MKDDQDLADAIRHAVEVSNDKSCSTVRRRKNRQLAAWLAELVARRNSHNRADDPADYAARGELP